MKPYYQDEWVTIYHGDCREILPELPKVDLVLTDMPYNDLRFDWLCKCFELLVNNGSSFIITDCRSVAELKLELDKLGIFRNWIIWCYRGIARKVNKFQMSHDDILYYTKSNDFIWNQLYCPPSETTLNRWGKYMDKDGNVPIEKCTPYMRANRRTMVVRDTRMRDWWDDIPVVGRGGNRETTYGKHPFQKPLDLIKRIMLVSSEINSLILDPFLGSGTTAYCAKKLNRKCIGIEIEEKHCEIAANRCRQAVMGLMV